MTNFYIGLMSGTSLDGVDGVLVDFSASSSLSLHVLAHVHCSFQPALARELLDLNTVGVNELHRVALSGNALARVYGDVVKALSQQSGVLASQITAVGAHGQTVRHRPQEFDGVGYTWQLNNPALLAELCGIDVVADFRARDVAAGGQGAPLVPAFHRAVFAQTATTVAVLNIGGMSNLTVLHADGLTTGFDCGPGNVLLDHWAMQHLGQPFDDAGSWAASGQAIQPLLSCLLTDPYFSQSPPKSTGRDLFNAAWLSGHLRIFEAGAPVDVQATLVELTVLVCLAELRLHAADAQELIVCGGGAYNLYLMQRLAAHAPGLRLKTSADRGFPAHQVEACAFAWLARAFTLRECANLPNVTGAAGARILGALYPSS
jgi:anhydro-N-acetylmuramic acid kinase